MLLRFLMAGLTASSLAKTATAGRAASSSLSSTVSATSSKILYVVRHGQAVHNPRAEAAKENNCSTEEFFRLMREDDALDADLTDLGKEQANRCYEAHFSSSASSSSSSNNRNKNNPLGIDLVVASCLSRTMDTADLVFPHYENDDTKDAAPRRISIDNFREVNGNLLNGKRRTKSELLARHPNWNFDSLLTEHDESWTPEMEEFEAAAERGYRGLVDLLTGGSYNDGGNSASMNTFLLVCHGGILRYMMNIHPLVHLCDERTDTNNPNEKSEQQRTQKTVESRFENCELRKYRLSWKDDNYEGNDNDNPVRRAVVLTQVDH
uniref:Phosphoglycerate mutase (2,3-diphosphoglycerate-dependent) n=1 Tax=Pseudo-nitzschia australis TaxID=44445 RepID=A0A7S4AUM3_9STRA